MSITPIVTRAFAKGPRVIVLEWAITDDAGVVGCEVTFVSPAGIAPMPYGPGSGLVEIAGLEPSTEYSLKICAVNEGNERSCSETVTVRTWAEEGDRPPGVVPPPVSVSVADYENATATLQWVNGENYDKILIRYGVAGTAARQLEFSGHPTRATLEYIEPKSDYVILVKGGRSKTLGGYLYSAWTSLEWRTPDGPRPMTTPGRVPVGAKLAYTARRADHHDLFAVSDQGRVLTTWFHPTGWASHSPAGAWRDLGGIFPAGAPVAAVARTGGNLDLFITGNDGHVYTSWWTTNSDWSGVHNNWRDLGGIFPAGAPVAATHGGTSDLRLAIAGTNRRVYAAWFESTRWSTETSPWRMIGG